MEATATRRRGVSHDDEPKASTRRRPAHGKPFDRLAWYSSALRRAAPALCCSLVFAVLAGVLVMRAEHSNEFQSGSYTVTLGSKWAAKCELHGLKSLADSRNRLIDVTALEPGVTDPTLLRLRYIELDRNVESFILVAQGMADPGGGGSSSPWVWSDSGDRAQEAFPAASLPAMRRLIADYRHKLTVVIVPPAAVAKARQGSLSSGLRGGGRSALRGDEAVARALLRAAGPLAMESAGASLDTLLVLGRSFEIPRASALELLQSCSADGPPFCLATPTFVLSFEFRKPGAFKHTPLVVRVADLVAKAGGAEAAGSEGQPWEQLDLGSFNSAGLSCLAEAGWSCEHCTQDWSLLEPAAVSSLRSWVGAGFAKRSPGKAAYRAMYEAYCSGEDPLGASPIRGLDVQVSAIGVPLAVSDGIAGFYHLLPGRCEGGKGAEMLWKLVESAPAT
ncbi:hypothetical protein FNF27_00175 [Cafeteria roenbergensis]|uniref:Uncharacterized protein n=1 Tax=Cafeteria roenbergensis TaxID=33653 RepID=A0A5A8DHT2_CAFRO|nr:hypothetical protein FNF31_02433 [Cafeteria roenbergensis]KAA0178325.1 hypothetical protein FNF27_00175 [Cafeteria roenbergensis]